jgi:hypothetical protein
MEQSPHGFSPLSASSPAFPGGRAGAHLEVHADFSWGIGATKGASRRTAGNFWDDFAGWMFFSEGDDVEAAGSLDVGRRTG